MGRSAPLGFDCISKFQAGRTASTLQVQNVWLHNQQPITIINSALSKSLSSAIYYLSAFLTSKCFQVEDLRLKTVPRIEILILGCFLSLSFFAAPLRVGNLYWASNFRAHILVSRKICFSQFFIFGHFNLQTFGHEYYLSHAYYAKTSSGKGQSYHIIVRSFFRNVIRS